MQNCREEFIQMAVRQWNMSIFAENVELYAKYGDNMPDIVALGRCAWCTVCGCAASPPPRSAAETCFQNDPAAIIVDLRNQSLCIYALSPIENRIIAARDIPWKKPDFWAIGTDYLRFCFEIDKQYGKKRIESNFVRDFKKSFELLDASWQNIAPGAQTRDLSLTTLLRLVFIANIAARGALDGRKNYLSEAMRNDAQNGRSAYRSTIRPLFFDALGKPMSKRGARAKKLGNIPFLNGGLFAPIPAETENPGLDVSNETLLSIAQTLFEPYAWNIYADAESQDADCGGPDDAADFSEPSLDPRMIGHIFETLMPQSLRERTGSFYTPMPLAKRVVGQAFEIWLGRLFPIDRDALRALLDGRPAGAVPDHVLLQIEDRIAHMRILDPAAGSGAFLRAAFEKLLFLRRRIAAALGRPVPAEHLAKQILASNLFGADILPAAVKMCELRLWLELIRYAPKDRPLIPLPNLDLSISCGDSLLNLQQWQRFLGIPPQPRPPGIDRLLRRFKTAHGAKKYRLRKEIGRYSEQLARDAFASIEERCENAIKALSVPQKNIFDANKTVSESRKKRIAELCAQRRCIEQMRGEACSFGFGIAMSEAAAAGGFDLIIGNPPWFGLHTLAKEKQNALRLHYQCAKPAQNLGRAAQAPDISSLFVEKALFDVNANGCIAMIVPNKLFSAPSYQSFRRFIENRAQIFAIDDLSRTRFNAFGAATYPAAVILAPAGGRAAQRPQSPWIARIELARRDADPPLFGRVPPIKSRFDVRRGICTGANDVYLCESLGGSERADGAQYVRFAGENAAVPIESQLICSALRGCDIRPFHISPKLNIALPHDPRFPARPLPDLPPCAKKWFDRNSDRLRRRKSCRFPYDYAISGIHPAIGGKKVVWRDIATKLEACYCPQNRLIPVNTVYYIPVADDAEGDLLAAWLNSGYIRDYCIKRAEHAQGGYRRFFAWLIQSLPWPFDHSASNPYKAQIIMLSRKARELMSGANAGDAKTVRHQNRLQAQIDDRCQKCIRAVEIFPTSKTARRNLPVCQSSLFADHDGCCLGAEDAS